MTRGQRKFWNFLTTFTFGLIATDLILNSSGFVALLDQLIEAMEMRKYIVVITLDEEVWGEYVIFASTPQTACFIAGLKYHREEQQIYPGTKIGCSAAPFRADSQKGM